MAERIQIVYIEDDQDMVDLVSVILSRDDFEIIGVREGTKALETIRQVKPALVLLDLMLPDMGGWEIYQAMKQEPTMRDIPVIVITARGAPIDKVLGEHVAKVQVYLVKPFSTHELRDNVKRVLGMAS
ncbi:MAG: response regulator [Anaerolineae bacterium]